MNISKIKIVKEFDYEEGEFESNKFKEFDSKMLELGFTNRISEGNKTITYEKTISFN